MKIRETTSLLRDLKSIGQTFNEIANVIRDTTLVTKSVKPLVGRSRGDDLSSKLIAAGMACLIFPEPVLTDIIGWTLITAGTLVKRKNGPTITDIFREYKKVIAELKNIC